MKIITKCFKCGKEIKINTEKTKCYGISPEDYPNENIKKGDKVYFCRNCLKIIGEE